MATFFAAHPSAADPAVVAAVFTYVSAQQCVTETLESRRRSCRIPRMSALWPAEVTGSDPATIEQLGSSEVGTPTDCMTWHKVRGWGWAASFGGLQRLGRCLWARCEYTADRWCLVTPPGLHHQSHSPQLTNSAICVRSLGVSRRWLASPGSGCRLFMCCCSSLVSFSSDAHPGYGQRRDLVLHTATADAVRVCCEGGCPELSELCSLRAR